MSQLLKAYTRRLMTQQLQHYLAVNEKYNYYSDNIYIYIYIANYK